MGLLLGWTPPAIAPGDPEFVFQGTINLMLDPEDLTTGNWTEINGTAELSDEHYDGKRFSKVTNSGAAIGGVYQNITDTFTTLTPSYSVLLRKGNSVGNTVRFQIQNLTAAVSIIFFNLDWDNYPNSPAPSLAAGILQDFSWKDEKTVELRFICDALANLTDDIRVYCYGSNNAIADEYTYYTALQLEDLPYPTPYVNGSRAAAHPTEAFIMQSRFVIDMVVRPWFTYDIAGFPQIIVFYIDAMHLWKIDYVPAIDQKRVF